MVRNLPCNVRSNPWLGAFLATQIVKNLPATWLNPGSIPGSGRSPGGGNQVRSLGQEDPLEEETETHSSILDWEIPWTEEPGGLQSMWLQRLGHD